MSITAPLTPVVRHRRVLVAAGAAVAPIALTVGGIIAPYSDGTPAQQLAAIHAHETAYWIGQIMNAAGFALLGALAVAVAMLLPRRGAVLGTIGAVATLVGGVVMAGAVLTGAVVNAAIPVSKADLLVVIQSSPGVGILFQASAVAGVGGLLAGVALLIGRTAGVVTPILLIVGVLLSLLATGPLGFLFALPMMAAAILIARALLRAPAPLPVPVVREPVAA